MEHKRLGTTDIMVPAICLGTMTWGTQNSEAEAHEQLDYAVSQGINFIDTAEIYPIPPDASVQGRTESYIGTWLKKRGKRDDLIIATKVASRKQMNSFSTRTVTGLTRADIRAAIEGSLQRLQTDYIDLYQTHSPDRPANHWGVRGITEPSADDGGSLSGKYLGGNFPPGARFTLSTRNRRYNSPEAQQAIQAYVDVAQKHGLDPSQMAIAYVASRKFVTSAIIGATSMEQLKNDLAAGDLTLSEDVLTDIEDVHRRMPDLIA